MSLKLFKQIANNIKQKLTFNEPTLKPRGEVTIWDGDNIVHQDKNLVVNSYFDIMVGLFEGDSDKLISKLKLGDGGIYNSIIQTPTVQDLDLYNLVWTKVGYDSMRIERILENSITFVFIIEKDEGNGSGVQVYNEMALTASDGTIFARKVFQEIVKYPAKEFKVEWRLVW